MKALTEEEKERNRLLVAALESGLYDQANGRLRSGDKFCCLGVACEVYRKKTGLGMWHGSDFVVEGLHSWCVTPEKVAEWYGWAHDGWSGYCTDPTIGKELATFYNDTPKEGFPQIAARFKETFGL